MISLYFFSNSKQTNKKITPWYYTNVECHAVSEYQQNLLFTFFSILLLFVRNESEFCAVKNYDKKKNNFRLKMYYFDFHCLVEFNQPNLNRVKK